MTAGELRAALVGVRDEAVLLGELRAGDPLLFGAQFAVDEVMPIGGSTDDPGVVLKLRRTR
jgi:hypothetical protein